VPLFPLISLRQTTVTKVRILFVILAAVALKTEGLKIVERIPASLVSRFDTERPDFWGRSAHFAMAVAH
jgi:hypothetical protein